MGRPVERLPQMQLFVCLQLFVGHIEESKGSDRQDNRNDKSLVQMLTLLQN